MFAFCSLISYFNASGEEQGPSNWEPVLLSELKFWKFKGIKGLIIKIKELVAALS
jgi:hypothetical protein